LRTTWAILIALVCTSIPALAKEDDLIVPGAHIGRFKLGDTQQKFRAWLGKPARTFKTHAQRSVDVWRFEVPSDELEVVYEARKAVQIRTNIERFETKRGLSVLADLAAIKIAYPQLKGIHYYLNGESGDGRKYWDEVERGIAFEVWQPWKEDNKERPYFVIVHPKGRNAIPTDISDPSNREPGPVRRVRRAR